MDLPIQTLVSNSAPSTSGTTAGKTAGNGGKFANALVQVINGNADSAANSGNATATNAPLLGFNAIVTSLFEEEAAVDTDSLIAQLSELIGQLQVSDDQTLDTENGLNDWIAQASELLAGLMSNVGANQQTQPAQSTETVAIDAEGAKAALPIVNVQQLLSQLMKAANRQPANDQASHNLEQLQVLLQKLPSALQTAAQDLAAASVTTDSGKNSQIIAQITEQLQPLQKHVTQQKTNLLQQLDPATDSPEEAAGIALQNTGGLQIKTHFAHLMRHPLQQLAMLAADSGQEQAADGAGNANDADLNTLTMLGVGQDAVRALTADNQAKPIPMAANAFAQDMSQFIVKNLGITKLGGVTEATISLFPEQLGQVDVRITLHNGVVTAMFVADNAAGKEVLENQLAQLRTALQNQGLQVDKLQVSQSGLQSGMFQDHRQQQQQQQNFTHQNRSRSAEYDEVSGVFTNELDQQSAHKELGYGTSINVTA